MGPLGEHGSAPSQHTRSADGNIAQFVCKHSQGLHFWRQTTSLPCDERRALCHTMAVVLAGAVCCGQAVGFWFVLLFFIAVAINAVYQLHLVRQLELSDEPKDHLIAMHHAEAWTEASRITALQSPALMKKAIKLMQANNILDGTGKLIDGLKAVPVPDEFQANVVFGMIDNNNSEQISVKELSKFLIHFGVNIDAREAMIRQYRETSGDQDKEISKDEFRIWFAPFWKYLFPEMLSLPQFVRTGTRYRFEKLAEKVVEDCDESRGSCPFLKAMAEDDSKLVHAVGSQIAGMMPGAKRVQQLQAQLDPGCCDLKPTWFAQKQQPAEASEADQDQNETHASVMHSIASEQIDVEIRAPLSPPIAQRQVALSLSPAAEQEAHSPM